jgi:AraC-like DNA-binding protein
MSSPGSRRAGTQILTGTVVRGAIEDMAATVRQFFSLDAVQLEPGDYRCEIDFVATGSTFLYRENYPRRTHLRGELLGDRFGVAIPLAGPAVRFAGEEMNSACIASAMTGEEMDLFVEAGVRQAVVLVDREKLHRRAEAGGLPAHVLRALDCRRRRMPLDARSEAVARFRRSLVGLLNSAAQGDLRLEGPQFEEFVMNSILSAVDVSEAPVGLPPACVLVRRATEMDDAASTGLRITALCGLLRVSHSTLEASFKSVTRLTPQVFLRLRRLNRSRTALLAADPLQESVTDVATQMGFTELGRFAVRYRELFGESPSETLRRGPCGSVSGGTLAN